jgi:hypothetical protein
MSGEKITKISSREKNYFTMIPNVVFDMFTSGIINKNTFAFYALCKRTAGEEGVCFKGRQTLKKQIKCSTREIQTAKEELTKPRDFLNGKSLIILHKQDPGSQYADHIEIEDIWLENVTLYHDKTTRQKFPTLFPGEHPPVPIGTPPCSQGNTKKNNIKKENIKKKRTSVHKSESLEKQSNQTCETLRSTSLFKEDKNEISFPSEKAGQHVDDLYSEQLDWVLNQKTTANEKIDEKQVTKWIRKYDPEEIAEAIAHTKKMHEKKKKGGINNFYAYVQKRLDYVNSEKAKNIDHNKTYLHNVTKNGFLHGFIETENYCYHQNNKMKEVYFHLPPEEFKKQLDRCK